MVSFKFKKPEFFEVDFYYLMDFTRSMKDDFENVKKISVDIANSLSNATNNNARMGFGSFQDRISPAYYTEDNLHVFSPRIKACMNILLGSNTGLVN